MSKFGEIIDIENPVLLNFFSEWNDASETMHAVLRDVAAAIGDKGKVIKINIDKNESLANALKIKGAPTQIIYRSGEMVWRENGVQDANTLISLMEKYFM